MNSSTLFALVASATSFLAIDFVWLSTMAKRFYAPNIGHLLAESPRFGPAVFFYLVYFGGVYFFVLAPALSGGWSFSRVFLTGAVLGLIAYGTYDLTNQATLKDWPLIVTLVDLVWGASLTGLASVIGVLAARWMSNF